ncbi:MAG: ABC transporter permease [Clostridiales bacterium]|nr:ABC transporter permease [Clostridiales bacterium]
MAKYLIRRLLHGLVSVVIVVAIVMLLIYSLMDRQLIFATDNVYRNLGNNAQTVYKYQKWEEYGYIDYVPYTEWLQQLAKNGEIDEETRSAAASIGKKSKNDSEATKKYVAKFTKYYKDKGYKVVRLKAIMVSKKKYATGGQQALFAWKDKPLLGRLGNYFKGLVRIDTVSYVKDEIENRGLTFTTRDPVYGGKKFSPAIIGNGTQHKYLLYCNNQFPYLHQNVISINLGKSYTVNTGVDVFTTMTTTQGTYVMRDVLYPSGHAEQSADDLHTATYVPNSLENNASLSARFTDNYTNVITVKNGKSKIGYSFTIGIIATLLAYLIGIPVGVLMAQKKDKLVDKIGIIYIIFIMAVPSLAYIFLFKAIGGKLGLPTTFNMDSKNKLMYALPIISLALPSIGGLMRWLRRYMIDQMNSDYVKFARSGGLSEHEIFAKHIAKNAVIPIVHGVPGSILFAMTGAIITERVYVVPGAGNLLTQAINMYDNGVIVGVTLFYALLSVIAIIMGDVLMSLVDPRISFTSKAR